MKKVYICSPLKGDIQGNIERALKYCRDALFNEYCIPIAPHIYFTQFLDDTKELERQIGMKCGLELLDMCDELWVYGEPSEGMRAEIKYFKQNYNRPIIYKDKPNYEKLEEMSNLFSEILGTKIVFIDVTDEVEDEE